MKTPKVDDLLSEKNPNAVVSQLSFEAGIKLLEELVVKVESGSLPLEAAVSAYEIGALIIERLKELLSGAEEKLKVLQKN